MQINFTGHHIDVTDGLKEATTKSLSKVFRHSNKIMSANVTYSVEKLMQVVEAKLSVPGDVIVAKASDEDMYIAIDKLSHKLDKQVIKYSERHSHHRE